MALETAHQPFQLVGIQIGRRAAAQVVLRHLAPVGQQLGHALHLDFEMREVGLDDVVAGVAKVWQPQNQQRSMQKGMCV
jgi:hypothetical protein